MAQGPVRPPQKAVAAAAAQHLQVLVPIASGRRWQLEQGMSEASWKLAVLAAAGAAEHLQPTALVQVGRQRWWMTQQLATAVAAAVVGMAKLMLLVQVA